MKYCKLFFVKNFIYSNNIWNNLLKVLRQSRKRQKKVKAPKKPTKKPTKKVQLLDIVTEQNFNEAVDSVNQDLNPDDTLCDLSSEPDTDCEPVEHLPPIKSKVYDKNTFCMPFGLYKNMRAIDLINLRKIKINKMTGEEYVEYTGKKYIVFLLEQTWLNGPVKKFSKKS